MFVEFFASSDDVERLSAALRGAGQLRPIALLLPLAWQLRQRDTNMALQLSDEVEAAWSWIDSVSEAWTSAGVHTKSYPAGSWGPAEANDFLPVTVPSTRRPVRKA